MPISFSNIPADLKIPLYWVEVDPSMAGLPTIRQPALLVGTMLPTGDLSKQDKAIAIGTQAQADKFYGEGSELARMFRAYFANNFANEVWGMGLEQPIEDLGPPVVYTAPAKATITVAQLQTEAGTIHIYVGGQHVPVNIGAGDDKAEVAASIVEMLNNPDINDELPVIASIGSGMKVSVAAVAFGGVGYTVGDKIMLANGVVLTVATVAVGAVATVTIDNAGGVGAGSEPNNPVPSISTTGNGANATFTLTWIADPTAAVVILTCRWSGTSGNDIRIDFNYYGSIGGEEFPLGMVLTLSNTHLEDGTGVPDMEDAIVNLGEQIFEYVAMPYSDSTSLMAWDMEYGFGDSGRWGWRRQLYGHVFCARRGTYSDLIEYADPFEGAIPNSGVISIMAVEDLSPTPVFEWTAAYVAKAQRALINDPARPLQTLSLGTVKLAPLHDQFNTIELNSLAGHGFATQKAGADRQPMISRDTTTYQYNLYGQGDDAYELVTTLATLAKLIRNQRHAITSKFPRHKLANDGTRFGPGQAIVTPGIVKAELIAQYRIDEFNGLVEDTRNFKRHLLVERDPNNPNRLNVLYPPDLINQLRIFAVLAQFRLQYDRGVDVEIIGGGALSSGLVGITARPFSGQ
jgi:phage tail sheath gpL-like